MNMLELNTDIPQDSQGRRAWIRYQLEARGLSWAELGRRHGVKRNTVLAVFYNPYPRMERAIAEAIGVRPEQIWPERYDENGRPNRQVGRPKNSQNKDGSTQGTGDNVKKQGVA
jgi:Ner family transcriptional regulator